MARLRSSSTRDPFSDFTVSGDPLPFQEVKLLPPVEPGKIVAVDSLGVWVQIGL
jgi:hypothetical protein